jgi:O-antigen ligase
MQVFIYSVLRPFYLNNIFLLRILFTLCRPTCACILLSFIIRVSATHPFKMIHKIVCTGYIDSSCFFLMECLNVIPDHNTQCIIMYVPNLKENKSYGFVLLLM